MNVTPLSRLVRQNLRRNLKHFLFSAFGIVVGIGAFVFFLGLSGGVRKVVLGDIFPIDQVEVISPKTTLTGIAMPLDDDLTAKIRARPEVEEAFPKMRLSFGAKGYGQLMGYPLRFEVGGFCDGIDPVLVKDDADLALFEDWEEAQRGKEVECSPAPDNACPPDHYCTVEDHKCRHLVPVLISRTILEIYNGSFGPAHGLPAIGKAQEMVLRNRMKSMRFTIGLGASYVQGSTDYLKAPPREVGAQLVGISNKAMGIGMTVPIGYIRRWNVEYLGEDAATRYSSILVELKDKDDVASFVSWVKEQGYETEESQAERFALVISIVTLLFMVISFVIVGLSAVNISHTFFMLISERRREIGILRAVGASKSDVKKIILGEAGVIGLASGILGVVIGYGAARVIDFVSARFLPNFPFKPTTYFAFTPTLLAGALCFAVGFCLLGAYLPARRAAQMQPASALVA